MTRRGREPWPDATSPTCCAGVVTDVGEALDLWSVDLWTFSVDADTLECRAYWCRDPVAAKTGDCVGAVIGLDQSHDLRRLVLTAEVVERHVDDELSPADAAALAQAGFTHRIDVPLLAGAEVLGVLSLAETRDGRRLSQEDRGRLGDALPGWRPRCCARRGSTRTEVPNRAAHRHARDRPQHRRRAVAGGDRRRGARGGGAARRRCGVRRAWCCTPGRRHVRSRRRGRTGARDRRLAGRRSGAAGRGSSDGRSRRARPTAAPGSWCR